MALPVLMELFDKSRAFLSGKGISNARRECEWIFCDTLGIQRLELYTGFDTPVEAPQVDRLRERIARRGRREPLAYILGHQPFCSISLHVTPAVLIPRPETEELVEAILAAHDATALRVADIGTGSGAIALALAAKRPTWRITAYDVSREAVDVARGNAQRLGYDVTVEMSDLCSAMTAPVDLIVANLPYIGEHERHLCDPEIAHEPQLALFADELGLALIRRLVSAAPRVLAPRGELWLEHGFHQGAAIRDLTPTGWTVHTARDAGGHERWTRMIHD